MVTKVNFDVMAAKQAVASLAEEGETCVISVSAYWDKLKVWPLVVERLRPNFVRVHGVAREVGEEYVDVPDKGVSKLIGNAGKDYADGKKWRLPQLSPALEA